ncbi:PREDICTED: NF-kappa-B inhibitor zeta isoform X3 [Odobenus rosmarus divergens]|uniref:NF-kappa-B inhibitor zeta n=1 Tax=Odobenus rosmarus divergens TaxID=9708 RepID=A0A2U3VB48_ODORO|nr:PREDICTED: NF-kappa-B inhibitor zeta isoform X3 [Odobenus rosmarus divergens]
MIVDKLLDDSRGGEGLLDRAGDGGLMTSPLNLAYFYGASPPAAAPGACDAICSSSGPSAPGSPGSDSSDFSSASSVSSCGAVESRPRGGARSERLQVEPHMGVGRQQRGPFQGVRVKNSVKELLLHIRSHKQKASGQAVDDFKTQSVNREQFTELKNTVPYSGKRKGPDSLSDGPACKRPALLHTQFLTPPQTPTPAESMEDVQHSESKQDSSADLLQNIINIKNECSPVSLNTVQNPHNVQQQSESQLQNFNVMPPSACEAMVGHDAGSTPSSTSLPFPNIIGNPVSTTQLGKSFFQWQVEQEESKLANISQDQFLSKDADGDTFLHIAVAQGRRALSYVLARKMNALHMLDIKEHNGQSAFQVAVAANQHLIVQDLVNLGAQVNTTDCWGRTPLHVCAEKGHSQVLQAIQKGAVKSNQFLDLEATNYDGLTPLHCAVVAHNAVVHELQRNQQPHSPEVQELLLKNKSLVDTIKCLIQMGAAVEAKDRKSGRTALHLAAEEANLELIRLFLELPSCLSFVNAKAYNGNTALHVAASLQYRVTQLDAVRLLMRKGADPSTRNLENEQPVHLVPDGPVGEQIRRILKGKSIQQRAPPY